MDKVKPAETGSASLEKSPVSNKPMATENDQFVKEQIPGFAAKLLGPLSSNPGLVSGLAVTGASVLSGGLLVPAVIVGAGVGAVVGGGNMLRTRFSGSPNIAPEHQAKLNEFSQSIKSLSDRLEDKSAPIDFKEAKSGIERLQGSIRDYIKSNPNLNELSQKAFADKQELAKQLQGRLDGRIEANEAEKKAAKAENLRKAAQGATTREKNAHEQDKKAFLAATAAAEERHSRLSQQLAAERSSPEPTSGKRGSKRSRSQSQE